MMDEAQQIIAEIELDLQTLVTLTEPGWTPHTRGIMCAARIERAVRKWFHVPYDL